MSAPTGEPGTNPIVIKKGLAATPSEVFAAWTEPELVRAWFGSRPGELHSATIDLHIGGRWCFTEQTSAPGAAGFEGTYLEIAANRLLVFTWSKFVEDVRGVRQVGSSSRVEVRFANSGTGTSMTIIHSSIQQDEVRSDFEFGWNRALPNLVATVDIVPVKAAGLPGEEEVPGNGSDQA